ncbi:hypothetical protein J1C56_16185 [Aminobacter anthyllidis]|uniref:Uncharacterized protein n=1 Tax=Aminobacter anthyllidis TaxID=1035067 RepID=A0A9X1AC12_9HYPH|nr:hypothetical protein [Aminobacter anthyllidis]MBT1157135.1 hypothetical protein [Aminobacter anthyllidis]
MTDIHHLADLEFIQTELHAIRKHIGRSAAKALLEEVDTLLSVTESSLGLVVAKVRDAPQASSSSR